jgi:uncharacterized protein
MSAKKSKKFFIKNNKTKIVLLVILTLALIGIVVMFTRLNYEIALADPENLITGRNESSNSYKSLDLGIASTATFTSKSLEVVKDLGVSRGVKHQIIKFNVEKDGLVEYGLLTLPTSSEPPNGYPVVILIHGYVTPLYYSTEEAYVGDMEYYSSRGYAVIKPDLRGQGLSIGAGSAEGAYYSMAYNTDVMSLIASVKQTKFLNKDKINIWGHSMGGYIALRASVLSPDIKNTIILSAPVGNIQEMFNAYVAISDTNNQTAGAIRASQLAKNGTPVSNPTYWDKTSPLNYLNNSKSYYQIHTGSADQIVPTQFSAELSAALNKANKPHEYFVYQGGDHGLLGLRNTIWSRSYYRLQQTQ